MNPVIPAYKKFSKNNYLPVTALMWVPFWLLGIVSANFSDKLILQNFLIVFLSLVFFLSKKTRIFAIVLVSFSAGYFSLLNHQKKNAEHISNFLHYHSDSSRNNYIQHKIKARIVSHRLNANKSSRYIIELKDVAGFHISGRVLFYTNDELSYGDVFETLARIEKFKTKNPGQTDFSKIYRHSDIYAYARHLSPIVVTGNSSNKFNKFFYKAREFISNRIDERFNYSRPLARALILGERTYLNIYGGDFINKTLANSGLLHLFAVSGLHVGIIFLFVYHIFVFFRFKQGLAKLLTVFILLFYAFICSYSPSILRAVIFFSMFLLAGMSSRLISKWQVLLVSLFLISLFNPYMIFSPGLQFSYTAMAGIIISGEVIKKSKISAEYLKIYRYALTLLIINILVLPLQVYYFRMINFNSFISNIIGIPLVSLILPLFFMVLVLPEISLFGISAEFLSEIFNRVSLYLGELPFRYTFSLQFMEVIMIYLLFTFALFSFAYSYNKKMLIRACVLLFSALLIFIPVSQNNEFKVIFFDVGNADCALIEFPCNDFLLIDTGDRLTKSNNISKSLIPYLQQTNVRKISKVILTHEHSDHYGGIFELSKNIKIDTIFVTDTFIEGEVGKELLNYPYLKDTYFYVISDTLTIKKNDYRVKFLHPDRDYTDLNENNNSIVCMLSYKDLNILFTGDIEREAESYILQKYPQYLKSDILKVAHHGSITSTTDDFLLKSSPKVSVISAFGNVSRGFPSLYVLQKLDEKYFVTGNDGAVIVKERQDNLFTVESFYSERFELILKK